MCCRKALWGVMSTSRCGPKARKSWGLKWRWRTWTPSQPCRGPSTLKLTDRYGTPASQTPCYWPTNANMNRHLRNVTFAMLWSHQRGNWPTGIPPLQVKWHITKPWTILAIKAEGLLVDLAMWSAIPILLRDACWVADVLNFDSLICWGVDNHFPVSNLHTSPFCSILELHSHSYCFGTSYRGQKQ